MNKIEHNVETGEVTEIELTTAEIAEIEAAAAIVKANKNAKATEKAALLERLGITADEAALLLS